jgi:hypothetical protein
VCAAPVFPDSAPRVDQIKDGRVSASVLLLIDLAEQPGQFDFGLIPRLDRI